MNHSDLDLAALFFSPSLSAIACKELSTLTFTPRAVAGVCSAVHQRSSHPAVGRRRSGQSSRDLCVRCEPGSRCPQCDQTSIGTGGQYWIGVNNETCKSGAVGLGSKVCHKPEQKLEVLNRNAV
jgi:hypothetical protein